MIDETNFKVSTEDFSGCRIKGSGSFVQKAISIFSGDLKLDVVQLDDRLYCIHLHKTKTSNTQSLIISGYDFLFIQMPDLMTQGQLGPQLVPRIQFHSGFFRYVTIAIMDEEIVLTR
jgi:hypothetical protein